MKKILLLSLLIALICSIQAQKSLDSLRLVLPVGHTSYVSEILVLPETENSKAKLLTSDGAVHCVWDCTTKKLLYSFNEELNSGILKSSVYDLLIYVNKDTLQARNIIDGAISYRIDISSNDFMEDWTKETIDEIKLSADEKSIIVIYQNHKKHIWKINLYDVATGKLMDIFSGEYFDHLDVHITPNQDFILLEMDNTLIRLDYMQTKKTTLISKFDKVIKSYQVINGTSFCYLQTENSFCVYDFFNGSKKYEFTGEYFYFKDSILVTIHKNDLIVYNALANEKIYSRKIKKLKYDSGEYIEPTVVFSSSNIFLAIKNGTELFIFEIEQKKIKQKISLESELRYITDFGDVIIEESLFKCLHSYNLYTKKTIELFCPDQFDGNGEVNKSSIIYEDPEINNLFIGGFRQICQLNIKRKEVIAEYKPQIKTTAAVGFDPKTENLIIQGYTDIKQQAINLSLEGRVIENNNFWCNGYQVAFNIKSDIVAVPSRHNIILLFSYPEFKELQQIETEYIGPLKFSHDDNYLINRRSIIDLRNTEIIFESNNELWIDSTETTIIEKDYNSDLMKIRDIKSLGLIGEGRLGESFDILDNQIFWNNNFDQGVLISKDRKMLYSNSKFQQKSFLDENWILDDGKKVNRVQFLNGFLILFTSDSSDHYLSYEAAHLFSLHEKKWVKDITSSDHDIFDVEFSQNGKFIARLNKNNSIILIDVKTNNVIYEYLQLENNNWLVKLPNSPYYMCSKDASKMLHYVTPSLKVIGFEQLDPVYNRPDIVLDSIGKYFGGADQELVASYRQSWEKRIDRLGLEKEKLGKGEIAVPNAEIVGADAIAYENKNGKLDIKVVANDPKYPLRRFNVYVNEVPLYGSAGISIAHLKKQVWDTTVSVPLSMGENKIQVSVMNELGLENFKYPTYVNYSPQNELVAKTYFIGIGVNEFVEQEHNLKYCVKDVQDLAMAFADGKSNVDTLLLTNKEVTRENILKLKELLSKTSVNDKVIISCSSHGLLDDSLNFHLAMHDVDFKNPKARGLKYEELESLLDGIPARQKLLLLDACNSGENDKTEVLKKELEQKQVKMNTAEVFAARGAIVKLEEENKSNFKKMNELFVNVRNNTGSVIISAAGGQESALEAIKVDGETIENGAFTFSILEYLNSNKTNSEALTVNKLKQYAEKRVEEITNGKQKPTSRQETMEVDWGVR
jgi:hypothetical protein